MARFADEAPRRRRRPAPLAHRGRGRPRPCALRPGGDLRGRNRTPLALRAPCLPRSGKRPPARRPGTSCRSGVERRRPAARPRSATGPGRAPAARDVASARPTQPLGICTSARRSRSLGYPAADWITNPNLLNETVHPDDIERVLADAGACETGEAFAPSTATSRPTAASSGCSTRSILVRDEQDAALVQGFLVDITESKLAEETGARLAAAEKDAQAEAAQRDLAAQRTPARARPPEGRIHRPRLARAAHAADLDPRVHGASCSTAKPAS